MDNELVKTIISGFVATITASIAAYAVIYNKKDAKKKEKEISVLKLELKAISAFFDWELYSIIYEQCNIIFEETKVNRILFLFAINGKTEFQQATAIYEHPHKKNKHYGSGKRYVKVRIDDVYRQYIKKSEKNGDVILNIETMEDGLLKDIYLSAKEEVKHSIFKFIKRSSLDGENDAVVYSSVATTESVPFTSVEKTLINNCYSAIIANSDNIKFDNLKY
jgi:hypothetical protein